MKTGSFLIKLVRCRCALGKPASSVPRECSSDWFHRAQRTALHPCRAAGKRCIPGASLCARLRNQQPWQERLQFPSEELKQHYLRCAAATTQQIGGRSCGIEQLLFLVALGSYGDDAGQCVWREELWQPRLKKNFLSSLPALCSLHPYFPCDKKEHCILESYNFPCWPISVLA